MMKKIIVMLMVALISGLTGTVFAQSAKINKVWLELGVTLEYGDSKYLKINVDFNVLDMKGKEIEVVAFIDDSAKRKIYFGESANWRDNNEYDNGGYLSKSSKDVSLYDNTHWSEFSLYIPFKFLPYYSKKKKCYVEVGIWDVQGKKYLTAPKIYADFLSGTASDIMDIHKKFSHLRYNKDWGNVVESYRAGETYFFLYNSGWVEETKISTCIVCGGSGNSSCTGCWGTGKLTQYLPYYPYTYTAICSECNGSGRAKCWKCDGSGRTYTITKAFKGKRIGEATRYLALCPFGMKQGETYYDSGNGTTISNVPVQTYQQNVYSNSSNNSNSHREECWMCHGSGKCPSCAGRGEKRTEISLGEYTIHDCYECKGSGRCPYCHGRGTVYR